MLITCEERRAVLARMNHVTAISVYANLPLHLQEDAEIALRAVSLDGFALAHAPDSIRWNLQVCTRAVKNERFARQYAYALRSQLAFQPHRKIMVA